MKRSSILVLSLIGCGAPAPPAPTGGVDVPLGRCGRGLVVVASDYQSTNVALMASDGAVLSSSFLSSASESSGLSAPLSGDVVAPTAAQLGSEIVLVDRYPAGVLTFVELASARVRAQLDLRTGFASNPQDYLEVAPDLAFVSRYEQNPEPGREPFDGGSDVLLVDPRIPAIVGRVDLAPAMADAPGVLPRPWRMLHHENRVYLLLTAQDASFGEAVSSRLVVLDAASGALAGVTVLEGLSLCGGLAIEPGSDGAELAAPRLAVACTGSFDGNEPDVAESGVAILTTETMPPEELARFSAADLGGAALGFSLDFVDARRLLLASVGSLEPARPDRALELDLDTGAVRPLLEAPAFELGEVRCATPLLAGAPAEPGACGRCYVADAERGRLHLLHEGPGGLEPATAIAVDSAIGLPPRYLGRF